MAKLNTDKLVSLIAKAAEERDFSAVSHYISELRDHLRESGAPVSDETAFRLVESLSKTSVYESMPQQDLKNPYSLIKKIVMATKNDASAEMRAGLRDTWINLHNLLANPGIRVEGQAVEQLMNALKGTREHFDLLGQSADRFINRGQNSAMMHVHYAQALVDTGQPMAAIHTLESLPPSAVMTEKERDEVYGLLGRAHKQIYVNHVAPKNATPFAREKFQNYLTKAIDYYGQIYKPSMPGKKHYQGVNYIALLALADRHGVRLETTHNPRELAQDMLKHLEPADEADEDVWMLLSKGEANIAVGDSAKALDFYKAAIDHKDVSAFHLGSALRQIEEIWQSENHDDAVNGIALLLKAKLANMRESSFTISKDEYKLLERARGKGEGDEIILERQLPGGEQIALRRLHNIVLRAESVARIFSNMMEPKGTGFLVKGSKINPAYGDELLLMTNAHVVWDTDLGIKMSHFQDGALSPENALIQFELPTSDMEPRDFRCEEVLWQSQSGKHDVCLMRLDNKPINRTPMPIASQRPRAETKRDKKDGTRVAIIGHPRGGNISIASMGGSISNLNGHIVDVGGRNAGEEDPEYMHYRVPTEGGNSGSPVFETQGWKLIGIHHAGFGRSGSLRRLNGVEGVNIANEGILISSIRGAIEKDMKMNKFNPFRKNETKKKAQKLKTK